MKQITLLNKKYTLPSHAGSEYPLMHVQLSGLTHVPQFAQVVELKHIAGEIRNKFLFVCQNLHFYHFIDLNGVKMPYFESFSISFTKAKKENLNKRRKFSSSLHE
jgi:hypothetical protein